MRVNERNWAWGECYGPRQPAPYTDGDAQDQRVSRRGARGAACEAIADREEPLRPVIRYVLETTSGPLVIPGPVTTDLSLGLADCALVALAARYRTTQLLSFDERHFRAVAPLTGDTFTILPADR